MFPVTHLEPLHIITERAIQWPTVSGGTTPGTGIPVHALPILVKNNVQLANKPVSPPPHPTIAQTLTALPLSLQFSFNQVTLPTGATNVMSSYRVYRNTSANNFSGATLMRTFVHDPTRQGAITVQDNTGGGKTYYYFVTSVDTTSLESSPVGAQSGAVTSGTANPSIIAVRGSTVSPTTVSTTFSVIPEMTITFTAKGNPVLLIFSGTFDYNTTGQPAEEGRVAFFRDGSIISPEYAWDVAGAIGFGAGNSNCISPSFVDTGATAGSHTYDVRYRELAAAGTLQATGILRAFQVVELG